MNILMVTIGYPPKQVGGTEVYVFGLVEELKQRGHECSILYLEPFEETGGPDVRIIRDEHLNTPVHIVRVNTAIHKLEFVVFDAALRERLINAFREVVRDVKPDVIHVHPLQLGFDSYLIEDFNQSGHKVVLTFHSSTTTCARGDLIYMGKQVCDGLVLQKRCTKCLYHWRSVPAPVAATLSQLPLRWYEKAYSILEKNPRLRKLRSIVSIPLIIAARRKSWTRATTHAKTIVAVCDWVRDTIIKNDVSPGKVFSSRHGLRFVASPNGHHPSGPCRLGYLGRISPEKGIQPLIEALRKIPAEIEYEFEFCSSSFIGKSPLPETASLLKDIYALKQRDPRIKVLDDVNDDQLRHVLARWDALVVPSLWLESGPQVIYESFAVHTPVIGSRLGGIAELVKDQETGFLFSPGRVEELVSLIRRFAANPGGLRQIRKNIGDVRTTSDVAKDMLEVYQGA
jgi:glycosyltransferase involved in cell wall biosynthesis